MRRSPDPLDAHPLDRVAALRMRFEGASPERVLEGILAEFPDHSALVSSFGAEAAVLLHMVARIDPGLPVLLVDTLMLFEETLQYQRDLSAALGLVNVQHLRPDAGDLARLDPDLDLNRRDPDACCVVRKVAPLDRALQALAGGDLGAQAIPGRDPRGARGDRDRRRAAEGQSARALVGR